MGWNRRPGCAIRWKNSRRGLTAGLMSCCRWGERWFARWLGWTLTQSAPQHQASISGLECGDHGSLTNQRLSDTDQEERRDGDFRGGGVSAELNRMPLAVRKSMTYDQGREMARHAEITQQTGVAINFCDPHNPWQRGSNENINGLVRQYLPEVRT